MSGQNEQIVTPTPIPKEPRPLHWTFYRAGGATTNREQDRWAIRHHKKHRISGRSKKFNDIKRKVKSIRMRQSVAVTVAKFTR